MSTLSVPSVMGDSAYPGGGTFAGSTAWRRRTAETCCSRRMSMNDTSLYANCPRVSGYARGKKRGGGGEGRAHLLPEADARAGVEREEDERVGREVLGDARVEEAVRVEPVRCGRRVSLLLAFGVCAPRRRTVGAPEVLAPVHDEDGVQAAETRVRSGRAAVRAGADRVFGGT